jgi:aspartyl/glutamyl-tRNA(Asn/Gln) amidotransferase C subunit
MAKTFTADDVRQIAGLANIPVTAGEEEKLAEGFNTTMQVVDQLQQVDVESVEPTSQVTDKENELREDKVDTARMFTQQQALSGATRTHNGYFVVEQVIEQQ